ncbi:hypothetical protein [Inquilinus sp. CA228]|uniref:hypothetical protein n=1 Tax=Inquilinus sp. CA228 TaxID=3455609 RepID=UPI003F8D5553
MTRLQIAFVVAPAIAMVASAVVYLFLGEAAAMSVVGSVLLTGFVAAVLSGGRD